MSEHCGYITKITNLRKVEKADRLMAGECFGNTVVVDLTYKDGEVGVYFPTDLQLDYKFADFLGLLRKKDENGNSIGGYMDADKRNITAVKLRGEKSDGLFIHLSCYLDACKACGIKVTSEDVGTAIGEPVCQKYIPCNKKTVSNPNSNKSKKKFLKRHKFLNFVEHADTEQLQYNLGDFKSGDYCEITIKMDGCFDFGTRVQMWNGHRSKRIGEIKPGDEVIGMKNGTFCKSVVLEKFKNGTTKSWNKIVVSRDGMRGEKFSKIITTPDHLFYDYKTGNYIPSKELQKNQKIGLVKNGYSVSNDILSVLCGMILGDGSVRLVNKSAQIYYSQMLKHKEYVEYIRNLLPDLFYIENKIYRSGYGTDMVRGKTKETPQQYNFFNNVLSFDGINKLKEEFVSNFNWLSLAIFYMDDGALAHNYQQNQRDRATFSICDYNEHDSNIIIKCFQKLGLNPVLYSNKGFNYLRINSDDFELMVKNISRYVCPVMRYKLPEYGKNCEQFNQQVFNSSKNYDFVETTVVSNEPIEYNRGKTKYDLHTTTDNYVVGNVLVHNCSQRSMITKMEVEDNTFLGRIKKLFQKEPKYVWTDVCGTRRVILDSFDKTSGWYGNDKFREAPHNKVINGLRKGEEVFYEVVGYVNESTPIRPIVDNKRLRDKEFVKQYGEKSLFNYGCAPGETDFYVYRMTMTNEDGDVVEYTPDYMRYRCEQMGVKYVPLVWSGFIPDEKKLNEMGVSAGEYIKGIAEKYYEGADPIGKTHIREGVVVRIVNRPKFTAYKLKGFYYKVLAGIAQMQVAESNTNEYSADILSEM